LTGRVFERKRRQMPCTLRVDGKHHGGLILDVSPGGLFIQSSAKIKPGDRLEIQTTLPGVEGRVCMQVEVVRKVIVPAHLLKVARGGVGVRILSAPESYYQFMDALGVSSDPGKAPHARAKRSAEDPQAAPAAEKIEPAPQVREESAPQPRFRVRIKQARGPRSRAVEISAGSEEEAQRRVLAEVDEGWLVLAVERIQAD
jgi:hypothetical protein